MTFTMGKSFLDFFKYKMLSLVIYYVFLAYSFFFHSRIKCTFVLYISSPFCLLRSCLIGHVQNFLIAFLSDLRSNYLLWKGCIQHFRKLGLRKWSPYSHLHCIKVPQVSRISNIVCSMIILMFSLGWGLGSFFMLKKWNEDQRFPYWFTDIVSGVY